MSMMVNPFRFAAVGPYGSTYGGSALVNRSSNLSITGSSATNIVAWNAEQYDDAAYHDNATNSERLSVPLTQDGDYFRATFGFNLPSASAQVFGATRKNGADFSGEAVVDTESAGGNGNNGMSAPIPMAAGDYFTINCSQNTAGSITLTATDGRNFAQIERLTDFHGALLKKTSDQSLTADTTAFLTWDAAVYDTLGFWSAGAPTRFTVPAGVSLVRLSGNAYLASDASGGSMHLVVRRNGNAEHGLPRYDTKTAGGDYANITSALIEVTPGDYFEMPVLRSDGQSITAGDPTWFAIEAVDPNRKRALVYRDTNFSIPASTLTIVNWDAEVYDTDGFHSTASNTSRLTVPAGVSRIRLIGNLYCTPSSGQTIALFLKNGATTYGLPEQDGSNNGSYGGGVNLVSAILEVTPGDYFEMQVFSTSATTIGTSSYDNARTWFAIEVLS